MIIKINRVVISGVILSFLLCQTGCLQEKDDVILMQSEITEETGAQTEKSTVCVYVCGCVSNPGVYELVTQSRICDAIDAAGGFLSDAAMESVNLAEYVEDGQQITVLSVEDYQVGQVENGLVNINKASVEELMTLPGIGEAKAKAIVSYRESNGNFKTIEDIMNVSGIKEGAFSKIKDMITK